LADREVESAPPRFPSALCDGGVQSPALAGGLCVKGQGVEAVLDDRETTHSISPCIVIGCGQDAEVKLAK